MGFEGLTEESEHTRWFLSMSAMLGAVRAHSLSVSHSLGPSLLSTANFLHADRISMAFNFFLIDQRSDSCMIALNFFLVGNDCKASNIDQTFI